MEDTRITDPAKLNTLLIIVTLAMAWAHAAAAAAQAGAAIKKRAHGYRYESWFRLGFDLLRNSILYQPDKAARTWTRTWPKRRFKSKTLEECSVFGRAKTAEKPTASGQCVKSYGTARPFMQTDPTS